jgi:hypothetical protein
MVKHSVKNVRTGQLASVKIIINKIHNDGLRESVSIQNQGTIAQPISGWVLASLRGELFYAFPDQLIFLPGMTVFIHSGQGRTVKVGNNKFARIDLFWTNEQVWNNHGDLAILFDANGVEIDRFVYPHVRVMGSTAEYRKRLVLNSDGYQITDIPVDQQGRPISGI